MRLALPVRAILAAAVVALSVREAARHSQQASTASGVPAPLAMGTALPRPRPVPAVALTDEHGRTVSLSAWRGKWVVLAPFMTLCHEVCPMTTAALGQAAWQLARAGIGGRVAIIEVSNDPWRDSPARLRAYRRLTGANLTFLTGSQAVIRQLWRFFGVYYRRVPQANPPDVDWLTHKPETFDVQHSDAVFFLDPAGQERILDEGMPDVGGRLPARLTALLNDQGNQNLAHPQF